MKMPGRLHVITDCRLQKRYSHAELAARAARGGADVIQFRQKDGSARRRLHEARRTAAVCRDADVPLIVNDDLAVALAVDAAGVHLGQEDFPIAEARSLLGGRRLIGGTATTIEQAIAALDGGADYIGFGPVFHTTSKTNPASVKGLEGLQRVAKAVDLPVIAIGGITPERVPAAMEAGAFGVAVLSGVALAENVESAAADFRRAVDTALAR